jgi:C4-type Zn-finger protein
MQQVNQLTQISCRVCGMSGILPRTHISYDRRTQEEIIEAVWSCPRCGTKIDEGVISRKSLHEK